MSEKRGKLSRGFVIFLYATFLGGAIMHAVEALRPWMLVVTEPLLLLGSVGVLTYGALTDRREKREAYLLWLAIVIPGTFVIEVIGVATGLVFGQYAYGEVIGWQLFGVPLIIGLLWMQVALGGLDLVSWVSRNAVVLTLGAALLAVGFDFALEPVAIKLGYWDWPGGVVPWQNYLAWFVIAAGMIALHRALGLRPGNELARHLFFAQVGFFVVVMVLV